MDATDPITVEELSQARLAPYWEYVGVDIEDITYPVSTSQVLSLVTLCDYRADGDFVLGLVNAGTIPVPRIGGKFAWSAHNILSLIVQLEARRRWKLSPLHLGKMSAIERNELEAQAAGESSSFADLDAFDLEALLIFMQDAELWAVRHACLLAIRAKLRAGETL